MLDVLEGRKPAPKNQVELDRKPDVERRDNIRAIRALLSVCDGPTEEKFLNMARLVHERDVRTCIVSSRSFRQSFVSSSIFTN